MNANSAPERPRASRWHALDTLRAAAMGSVLISHGSLAYIRYRVPGLPWLVQDKAPSMVFDALFHWTRVAVPLFFALSGFFAVLIYESKGPRGFFIDRAKRILVPLMVGMVTIGPLSLWIWAYGWYRSGRCGDNHFLRLGFRDPELRANRLGTGHLWFLSYAICYLLLYAAFRHLAARRSAQAARSSSDGSPGWARWLFSPMAPAVLALPTTLILWGTHEPNGLDALLNRRNAFLPEPSRFLNYGLFFAFGTLLYQARNELGRLKTWAWPLLIVSLVTFGFRFELLTTELSGTPLAPTLAVMSAALGALTCWLSVFGLLGLALRYAQREMPLMRYLADASYWVYWSHMPVLGLLEVHLYPLAIPAWSKFLIVVSGTSLWSLASYAVLIRHTAVGRFLHGPRLRRGEATVSSTRPAGQVHAGDPAPPGPWGNDRIGSTPGHDVERPAC